MSWKDGLSDEQLESRKVAQREYRRKRREQNSDLVNADEREWRAANKDKVAQYNRTARARIMADPVKREELREKARVSSMTKEKALKERARKTEGMRRYRAKRKARGLTTTQPYKKRPRHLLDYRCYKALREFLYVGYMGRRKTYKSFDFDSIELVAHIAAQMVEGMDWPGYGVVWQIDHIMPLAKFDYETDQDDQFKAAWGLQNLRPLLASHNLSKGSREDGDWTEL